ncbi:MAG: Ni/Fe hydrogenase [Firmicutes bacterium HGW-Firmicutes-1]|jgi:hydrogenase large subunit|nr:MAG: Ni/Fe hydrogenase [Firmicutes bacterium HGW-Firmicutes-1]
MGKKIIINPVTRISGFLEIEVEVENHKVVDAKSSGMMFRGFEQMLKGRPPLDAIYFTQRICGICSTAHSMCSTLALENALKITPSENDRMIRDFIHGCEFLQNHIRHFFQYTLPDFVQGPDIPPLLEESHQDFRLPPKVNQRLAKNYIDALEYGRLAHKMLAVLGGKAPHNHGIFVGGVTVNMDTSKWIEVRSLLAKLKSFVETIMVESVYQISKYYPDYFHNGRGYGNLMSYGCYDTYKEPEITYLQPKLQINNQINMFGSENITESIRYAWYQGNDETMVPRDEITKDDRMKEGAYSWIKAPRYTGSPMEVGPLARMWLSGLYREGLSTMNRTIARVLEAGKIIRILEGLLERIQLIPSNQRVYEIPKYTDRVGFIDTTRGALAHWIAIEDQRIFHYEIITPSSWNLSPMDSKGEKGVVEQALIGTELEDVNSPVEIGRIVRSFDPCVSCATHVIHSGIKSNKVRVV